MIEPVTDGDGANVAHRATRGDGMTKTTPIEPAREVDSARPLTGEEHAVRNQREKMHPPSPAAAARPMPAAGRGGDVSAWAAEWDRQVAEWMALQRIERAEVLTIGPDDSVAVICRDVDEPEDLRRANQMVAKALGLDPDRVLIIAGDADLKVVRTADLQTVSVDDEPGLHGGAMERLDYADQSEAGDDV